MKTEIIKIRSLTKDSKKIKHIAQMLETGAIVAIPTETVYGLAVNALDKKAVNRLYEVKNRPKEKSFTMQIAFFKQLKRYSSKLPKSLLKILKKFWPGPLTVIINTKKGKAGLRMPDNKTALSIIRKTRVPLAVTSANFSGKKALSSAKEVFKNFNGLIEIVIDDGKRTLGTESTVLDCTNFPFKVLRNGAIADKIKRLL